MTELDEYVWRKDGAYGFEISKFTFARTDLSAVDHSADKTEIFKFLTKKRVQLNQCKKSLLILHLKHGFQMKTGNLTIQGVKHGGTGLRFLYRLNRRKITKKNLPILQF